MSFVPNRDLKRLNPMSNDWSFFKLSLFSVFYSIIYKKVFEVMNYSKTIIEYCLKNPGMVFDKSYEREKHLNNHCSAKRKFK